MAITRVNSVSVSGAGTSGAITVTVPTGTGITAGDLIVCCCVSNGTHVANGMTVQDSVNGTNYTTLLEQEESSASSYYQDTKYYQTPGAIADGSTFTFTPFASYVNAGIAIDIFRGCSGSVDQAAVGTTSSASTTIACPALGADATAGALVVSLAAGGGAVSISQSTITTGSTNTTDRSCGIAYNLSASGSSTYAVNWTQGSSSSWAGQTVSFAAAATGTTANAGLAAGTGTAQAPVPDVIPAAALAAGTGTGQSPGAAVTPAAVLAAGTGTSQPPVPAVTASAGLAAGTGTALQPTVSTSGSTTANAGLATGTGTSQGPSAAVTVPAGLAAGTGTAQAPVPGITASAGAATGTGAALSVTFSGPGYLYLGQEACTYLDYLDVTTGHVLSPVPGNTYEMIVASGRSAFLTVPPPGRPWSPGNAGPGGTFAPLVMLQPAVEDYAVMLARGRRHNSAMQAVWARGVLPRGEPPSDDLHKQLGCCPDP